MSSERYEAPEVIFNPSLIDSEQPGMHQLLFNMIQEGECFLQLLLGLY